MLKAGLRPKQKNRLNTPGLVVCRNLQVTESGLEVARAPEFVLTNPLAAMAWPFPQLMPGMRKHYLGTETGLYEIDSSWALGPIRAQLYGVRHWDYVDYGPFMVFTTGQQIIIDAEAGVSAAVIPNCRAMCDVNGQLMIGNTERGANWVEWSEIGYSYFTPGRSNIAGYRPLPTQGAVRQLKTLRTGDEYAGRYKEKRLVVAYCSDGIFMLTPYREPAPTYGLDQLAYFGITSYAGGDDSQHLFVDEGGYLRGLSPKGIKRLDYQEFMLPLMEDGISIVHNQLEDEWTISGKTTGYRLTTSGLSQVPPIVSGFATQGSFVAVGAPISRDIEIITDSMDLGIRANKLIETIELSGIGIQGTEVCGYWLDQNDEFQQGPWYPLSRNGIAYIRLNAMIFRIGIRAFGVSENYQLEDEIRIRWKLIDKTNIRGMYGFAKASAGADQ